MSEKIIITTALVSFMSGFMLGIYAIRGYFISPALVAEREANWKDPVESEESDIDEGDSLLDHAPNWANGEEADRKQGLRAVKEVQEQVEVGVRAEKVVKQKVEEVVVEPKPTETGFVEEGKPGEECKLVLVVRTDLGMTKGKIAAQCGHATLACYKTLSKAAMKNPKSAEARILKRWERNGQAKIAVQIKSQDDMMELMGRARSLGITAEVIADAGRTQIDPGSLTVLGVGPAPKSAVDQVTGGLKLL